MLRMSASTAPDCWYQICAPVLRTGGDVDTLAWVKSGADVLEFQLPKEELTTGYTCALLTQPAERSGWLIENRGSLSGDESAAASI